MNLVKELLKAPSQAQRNKIVTYVDAHEDRFAQLVDIFLTGTYRVVQRAAWPLSYCVQEHPHLIKPHLRKLLLNLERDGLPDAVKRNTLRLMQFIEIPKAMQGLAADICFRFLANPQEPVAVRVFSMTVLGNLAGRQPFLKKELKILIEDQLPYASAGFTSRARRVLKTLG